MCGCGRVAWIEVHDVLDVDRNLQLPADTAHRVVDREPPVDLAPSVLIFDSANLSIGAERALAQAFIQAVAMYIYGSDKIVSRK